MRRTIITLFVSIVICTAASGQSADFKRVYNACLKAQTSMSGGQGSKNEIREAAELLKKADWSTLILQDINVDGEAEIKDHLVFTTAFFTECANGRTVFERAEEYLKEENDSIRGGKVCLCTKCIKGNSSATYGFRGYGGTINVAAVAETNGKINVYVVVKDASGHESQPYKVSSNEFKGDSQRLLDPIGLPAGMSEVYITVENKHRKAKSVAIIVE